MNRHDVQIVTLGELGSFQSGWTFPPALQGRESGDIPFAKVGDISNAARAGNSNLVNARNYVSRDDLGQLGAKPLPSGSIVFAKIGEAIRQNFRLITSGEFLIDNNAMGFIPDCRYLDNRFIYHWFGTVNMYSLASKTTVPSIRKSDLERLPVRLPPLYEQRRIAAILDKADAIRRKRQEAIGLADEFLRAVFLDMFGDPVSNTKGWPVAPVGSVAEVRGGLQVTAKRAGLPIEVPYLRVANVFRDRIDLSEVKSMFVTDAELKRTRLVAGDVLVVEGHGNPNELGRSSVWSGAIDPIVHQNHLICIKPFADRVDSTYLSHFINSDEGRRQMLGYGKTTSGLNTLSTSQIRALNILLPPLPDQKTFSDIVAKVRKTTEIQAQGLNLLENLGAAIASSTFGEFGIREHHQGSHEPIYASSK